MNSEDVFLSTTTTNKFDISKILNAKNTVADTINESSLKRHGESAIHLASPPTDEGKEDFETRDLKNHSSLLTHLLLSTHRTTRI